MKLKTLKLATALSVATFSNFAMPIVASATPVDTPSGYLINMSGGWVVATMRVQADFPFTNPAGCSFTDGYATDAGDSGSTLLNSMLMTAFTNHQKVTLTIDGCSNSRPHIVGVNFV